MKSSIDKALHTPEEKAGHMLADLGQKPHNRGANAKHINSSTHILLWHGNALTGENHLPLLVLALTYNIIKKIHQILVKI